MIISTSALGPIWTAFTYLKDYDKNVQALEQEVENLFEDIVSLEQRVEEDQQNGKVILANVTQRLQRAHKSVKEARVFQNEEDRENGRCLFGWWCVVCRYCRSSSAKEKTKELKDLRAEVNLAIVSVVEPPREMESTIRGSSKEPKPWKHIEEEVMAALEDPEVKMIGICGLLGVGKTKLAQEVGEWAKEKKLFDEVIMVVVSQTPDCKKIQCAEPLGMELKGETLSFKASLLRQRLKTKKKVLIILDNVWKKLDLKELGIFNFGEDHDGGSKIILTSRNRRVCRDMGAEIFIVKPLSTIEARSVFAKMAGISIGDLERDPEKQSVVDECNCLPRLLVIVGTALKNQSNFVWYDAHLQLKRCIFVTLGDVCVEVYQPLESCYTNLKSQEAKDLFLLCCLLPKGFDISIDDLVIYGMGLNWFRGIETVVEARNRVCTLFETLKDDFLLLDSDWSAKYAEMLDIVRVGMSIAPKDVHNGFLIGRDVNLKKLPTYGHSKAMSIILDEITELPPMLKCPKLEFLLLVCEKYSLEAFQLPDNFFTELKKLKVLVILSPQIPSLPSSLGLLTSLKTLRIMGSWSVKNMSVVGKLVNLENLSLSDCTMVVLPEEIGNLKKLRLLELRYCSRLRTVPAGVIAGLHKLEALSMMHMDEFRWEVEEAGKKRSNASLKDLESLSKLTILEISLGELELIPRSLCLCSKLTRYAIYIGVLAYSVELDWHKFMHLKLPTITTFPCWVSERIKQSEVLWLESDGSKSVVDELNLNGFLHLKELRIKKCDELEYLTNAVDGRPPPNIVIFPILDTLDLSYLAKLIGVCGVQLPVAGSFRELKELRLKQLRALTHLWKCPTQNVCLGNLRLVSIDECGSLGSLLSLSIASGMAQLEELYISSCGKMVEVFSDESGDGNVASKIKFPKLKKIKLANLQSLIRFCGRIDAIEFPRLNELEVSSLPMIMEFYPKSCNDNVCGLQSLFDQKLVFGSLKRLKLHELENVNEIWCSQIQTSSFSILEELEVEYCNNLRHLFYPSMVRALTHLRHLTIGYCQSMEVVVVKEEKEAEDERRINKIVFPQLRYLLLYNLPNLRCFFQVKHGLDLPSLDQLCVSGCPELETFSVGSLNTPKLKAVESAYEVVWVDDLNTTIRHIYEEEKLDSSKMLQLHEQQNVTEMWANQIQTSLFRRLHEQQNVTAMWANQIQPSSFSKLEVLKVGSSNNLRHLFYLSAARALMHLQYLEIRNGPAMEEVVVKEEKEAKDERRMNEIVFPQLRYLLLYNLPNLKSFFQVKQGLDLPSLVDLGIYGCPELDAFSLGTLSMPKLKAVDSTYGDVWMHDLNTTISNIDEEEKGNYGSRQILELAPLTMVPMKPYHQEYVEASEGGFSEANITEGFESVLASLEESSTGPIVLDQSSQSSERGPLVPLEPKDTELKLNVHQTTNLNGIRFLSQFQDVKIQFLEVIRPFIDDVIHAERDGHCGFHVVANFMKFKDDGWKKVRNDLLDELETFKTDYSEVFFGEKHVAELMLSTQCEDATVDEKHWMILPDMGYVIASYYNIVVVFISSGQCLTFLPLRKQAPPETSHGILGIGYINENHFVGLKFKPDSPLPPVSDRWRKNRKELAKGWITPYENRMKMFRDMVKNTNVAISDI